MQAALKGAKEGDCFWVRHNIPNGVRDENFRRLPVDAGVWMIGQLTMVTSVPDMAWLSLIGNESEFDADRFEIGPKIGVPVVA
jgi:hypothetical protein